MFGLTVSWPCCKHVPSFLAACWSPHFPWQLSKFYNQQKRRALLLRSAKPDESFRGPLTNCRIAWDGGSISHRHIGVQQLFVRWELVRGENLLWKDPRTLLLIVKLRHGDEAKDEHCTGQRHRQLKHKTTEKLPMNLETSKSLKEYQDKTCKRKIIVKDWGETLISLLGLSFCGL